MRDDQAGRSGRAGRVPGVLGGVVHLCALGRRPVALRLAQQHVAPLGQLREARARGRVPGVDEGRSRRLDAHGEGGDAVGHRPAGQPELADRRPVAVVQLGHGEGGFDRAAGRGVGEEVGQAVRGPGRAVERDRRREVDVREQEAVVGGEQVRAVVGVEMGYPDRVELVQPHVPLERAERPAARVRPDPGAAARHQIAGARVVRGRVGRRATQDREVEASVRHGGSPPRQEVSDPAAAPGPPGCRGP